MTAEPATGPVAQESATLPVLVLCTGNSCRSQMAEGFLRHHGASHHPPIEAHSAGLEPKPVHPLAIRVMQEAGVDIASQTSKSMRSYLGHKLFATTIVVCAEAERACPRVFPFSPSHEFWPFDDPAAIEGTEEEVLAAFRRVRDQIEQRVREWLAAQAG
ncbi:MAG: arsenate reductase ArsC [Planctomycetota bacterium]